MANSDLEARLAEAEAARHTLLLGAQVAQVRDASGRQISYTPAERTALDAYIADLRRQLGQSGVYRAIRVAF